jgi:hypothetical protein
VINLLLFLASSVAVVVGVVFAMGLAWIAVIIPVLMSAGAGYGLFALARRGRTGRSGMRTARSRRMRA